jgi:hypothetical protein
VQAKQFGLGEGVPMNAGRKVAGFLSSGDAVLNLNYDVAFDLALKQASKTIVYAGLHPVPKTPS